MSQLQQPPGSIAAWQVGFEAGSTLERHVLSKRYDTVDAVLRRGESEDERQFLKGFAAGLRTRSD